MNPPLSSYVERLHSSISSIDAPQIDNLFSYIDSIIYNSGSIIFAGNGGSFANAIHVAGDYQKTFSHTGALFTTLALNSCALTAASNDISYEDALIPLLRPYLNSSKPTLLVLFSGSGNSSNLVRLVDTVILLTLIRLKLLPLQLSTAESYRN